MRILANLSASMSTFFPKPSTCPQGLFVYRCLQAEYTVTVSFCLVSCPRCKLIFFEVALFIRLFSLSTLREFFFFFFLIKFSFCHNGGRLDRTTAATKQKKTRCMIEFSPLHWTGCHQFSPQHHQFELQTVPERWYLTIKESIGRVLRRFPPWNL